MRTGESLAANTNQTVALFRFMDFRSLDTDSDKTRPHVWPNEEPQTGLVGVQI